MFIDSQFRVGGALGTSLQIAECPILSGGLNYTCSAALAMLAIEGSWYVIPNPLCYLSN